MLLTCIQYICDRRVNESIEIFHRQRVDAREHVFASYSDLRDTMFVEVAYFKNMNFLLRFVL